jgi:hypothetical protein
VSESVISCTTSQGFPSGLIPESISHTMPYNAFRISQRFGGTNRLLTKASWL